MLKPSIDKLLEKVPSKFQLVNIVKKRVKEMKEENNYMLDKYESEKDVGKALEEIYQGKVKLK